MTQISERLTAGEILILIPKTQPGAAPTSIVRGSGVVARLRGTSSADVYYEGNLYNAVTLAKLEQRVFHAWGRMTMSYPTVAHMVLSLNEIDAGFDQVGAVRPDGRLVLDPEAKPIIWNWVDGIDFLTINVVDAKPGMWLNHSNPRQNCRIVEVDHTREGRVKLATDFGFGGEPASSFYDATERIAIVKGLLA